MPVSEISNQNTSYARLPHAFPREVLDLGVLKSFETIKSDDGSDIIIELIDLYLQGTSERITAMRKASGEGDWTALKRLAHTLKGSSSTLGLRQIAETCHALESASSGSGGDLRALMDLLESNFLDGKQVLIAERDRRLELN